MNIRTVKTNDDREIVAPVVNLNGSSRERLSEGMVIALEAVRTAEEALASMMPHGRDYQTMPQVAYDYARREHMKRLEAVQLIMQDLEALIQAVQE